MPIMRIVSGEKPGMQDTYVLDAVYSGLSVHIHTRIFIPSFKHSWTCSLIGGGWGWGCFRQL